MDQNQFPLFAPGDILEIPNISHSEIVLYAVVYGLTRTSGYCWATNEYLAKRLNTSERTLQRLLSGLQSLGLITVELGDGPRKIYMVREHGGTTNLTGGTTAVSWGDDKFVTPPPPSSSNNKKREMKYSDEILELYKNYPRKMGKTQGLKKLAKEIKTETDLNQLTQAIDAYKSYCVKNQTEEQYIKHFSTFASCWREWVPSEETKKTQKQNDWTRYDLVDGKLVAVSDTDNLF